MLWAASVTDTFRSLSVTLSLSLVIWSLRCAEAAALCSVGYSSISPTFYVNSSHPQDNLTSVDWAYKSKITDSKDESFLSQFWQSLILKWKAFWPELCPFFKEIFYPKILNSVIIYSLLGVSNAKEASPILENLFFQLCVLLWELIQGWKVRFQMSVQSSSMFSPVLSSQIRALIFIFLWCSTCSSEIRKQMCFHCW